MVYWDKPQVWSILGWSQLDGDLISEAIDSFLKNDDAQHYQDVILCINKYNKVELELGKSKKCDIWTKIIWKRTIWRTGHMVVMV